jgi:hypothetical protein
VQTYVGSYTGNGNAGGQTITAPGFQPDWVIIKQHNNAVDGVHTHSSLAANSTHDMQDFAATGVAGIITSLTSTGFTVGNTTRSNTLNSLYGYVCVKFGSAGDAQIVSWVGNNASSRVIPHALGVVPAFIFCHDLEGGSGREPSFWRSNLMSGDFANNFENDAAQTGLFTANPSTTGFTVGLRLNDSGITYYAILFKNTQDCFESFSYTGNSSDNRNLTALNIAPLMAVIQRPTQDCMVRYDDWPIDVSVPWHFNNIGNCIQRFNVVQNSIQVGNDTRVNVTGNTYHGFAFGTGNSEISTVTKDYGLESLLKATLTKTHGTESLLVSQVTKASSVESLLASPSVEQTYAVESLLQATVEVAYEVDVLVGITNAPYVVEALLVDRLVLEAATESLLFASITQAYAVEAELALPREYLVESLLSLQVTLAMSAQSVLEDIYGQVVLLDTPRAFWHLSETSGATVYDSSGNEFHGTYFHSPTLGVAALPTNIGNPGNTAVLFDSIGGINNKKYIRIPTAVGAVLSAVTTFSIEFWWKGNAQSNVDKRILADPTLGVGMTLQLDGNGTNGMKLTLGPFSPFSIFSGVDFTTGQWRHVVITTDGSTWKTYLDNVLYANPGGVLLGPVTLQDFYIANSVDNIYPIDAVLDEFAIYNVELSPTQVDTHYYTLVQQFTVDSDVEVLLVEQRSVHHRTWARLSGSPTREYSVDVNILRGQVYQTQALLKAQPTRISRVQVILRRDFIQTFVNSILVATSELAYSTLSILIQTQTQTYSTQAALLKPQTRTYALQALIGVFGGSRDLDLTVGNRTALTLKTGSRTALNLLTSIRTHVTLITSSIGGD